MYLDALIDHLYWVKKRPRMYIGGITCQELSLYLSGIAKGVELCSKNVDILKEAHLDPFYFSDFVQSELGISPNSKGWAMTLDELYGNEAIDKFFHYWELYRKSKPEKRGDIC